MQHLGGALHGVLGYEVPVGAYATALRLDARRLTRLDETLRRMGYDYAEHTAQSAQAVIASLTDAEDPLLALFVAGCHRSGFVREAALREMPSDAGDAGVALALLRADDHVPQIRAAAMERLAELLEAEDASPLFERLDLVFTLRARRRFAAQAWKAIEARLLAPASAWLRWNATRSGSHTIRRFAWDLMARADADAIESRLVDAARDPHPGIALWALERAREVEDWHDIAEAAAGHPLASVRAESLRLRVLREPDGALPVLERALFDRAQTVRLTASFLLRGKVDALARWRAAADASAEPARAIALTSLADIALPEDRERFVAALAHQQGGMRADALTALARVEREAVKPRLLVAFLDPSPRVARTAFRLARKLLLRVEPSILDACFAQASGAAARNRVVANVDLAGKWESIALLLSWVPRGEPLLLQHALRERVAALNYGNAPLSNEMRERITRILGSEANLPEHVRREIDFALKTTA